MVIVKKVYYPYLRNVVKDKVKFSSLCSEEDRKNSQIVDGKKRRIIAAHNIHIQFSFLNLFCLLCTTVLNNFVSCVLESNFDVNLLFVCL